MNTPHSKKFEIFRLGIFLSALGSATYVISMAAFLAKDGVSAIKIGILFGFIRLNNVIVNAVFGNLADHLSPKTIIFFCEAFAAIGSGFVLYTYKSDLLTVDWFVWFFLANQIRFFFSNLQASSIQKIAKAFDNAGDAEGMSALKINIATYGPIFFGAIFSIFLLNYLNFKIVIIFDLITFLLNGLLVLYSSNKIKIESKTSNGYNLDFNFLKYMQAFPALARKDLLLAFAYSGQNTLGIRLVGEKVFMAPVLAAIFGFMVWFSSFLLPRLPKKSEQYFWVLCVIGLLLQTSGHTNIPMLLIGTSIGYLGYWLLFNSISKDLMMASFIDNFGGITASRQVLIILVLSLGEFWVGWKMLSLSSELILRSIICAVPIFAMVNKYEN